MRVGLLACFALVVTTNPIVAFVTFIENKTKKKAEHDKNESQFLVVIVFNEHFHISTRAPSTFNAYTAHFILRTYQMGD